MRFRICAWTETSRADVGSSQTMNSGVGGERPGDGDALALATGELVREFLAVVRVQPDQGQELAHPVHDLALALDEVEGADRLRHDPVDPPARVQRRVRVLEDHLDTAAQLLARGGLGGIRHGHAVDGHLAARGGQQAHHHAGHRGFPRAGFTDQREGLAFRDVEGDAVDGFQVLLLAALQHPVEPGLGDVEDTSQIFDLDEGNVAHEGIPSSRGAWVWIMCAAAVGSLAS
jgi:hypothetical protein